MKGSILTTYDPSLNILLSKLDGQNLMGKNWRKEPKIFTRTINVLSNFNSLQY